MVVAFPVVVPRHKAAYFLTLQVPSATAVVGSAVVCAITAVVGSATLMFSATVTVET